MDMLKAITKRNFSSWFIPLLFLGLFELNFITNKLFGINDYVTLAIFLLYGAYVFLFKSRTFFLFLYMIVVVFSNSIAIFAIQNGNLYLPELQGYGHQTGALLPITFVHFLFIQGLCFFEEKRLKEKKVAGIQEIKLRKWQFSYERMVQVALVGITLLVLLLFARVALHPAFFFGDRFIYQNTYVSGKWATITQNLLYLAPISFAAFWKYRKKQYLIPLLLTAVYEVWIGNKFTEFMFLTSIILAVVFYSSKKLLSKKNMLITLGVGLFLLTSIVFSNMIASKKTLPETFEYFGVRIAQQGQMFWRMYELHKEDTMHIKEYGVELKGSLENLLNLNNQESYGSRKVMRLTTPITQVENKLFKGHSRYTLLTDASVYYYFKYTGLIVWTIMTSVLIGVGLSYAIKKMLSCDLLWIFMMTRFVMFSWHVVFMASPFNFISKFNLFLFVLLCLWEQLKRKGFFGIRVFVDET